MIEETSTTQLVKKPLKKYILPLQVGDSAYMENLSDEVGRSLNFNDDFLAGKYLILYFVADLVKKDIVRELKELESKKQELYSVGANIVVISGNTNSNDNRIAKENNNFTFPVVSDPSGVTFAGFGLEREGTVPLRAVVLSPDRRVRSILDSPTQSDITNSITNQMKNVVSIYETSLQVPHPPVLMIPNVLSADDCQILIKQFETKGELIIGGRPTDNTQDYKFPVYDQNRQDRLNHLIADRNILAMLEDRLFKKVNPMIKKCFAFDVQKREPFYILRYTTERNGLEIGHRDNMQPDTAHRKFAFTLNLSSGKYKGGNVKFKEFSDRGYDAPPGTAIIFSSSLLHEVEEVTEGIRYTLISHLF